MMATAGRQPKLTPEVHKTIVEHVADGAYDWVAAEAAGIGQRTFYTWMTRGAQGDVPYRQFQQDIRQARALARSRAERRVMQADPFKWLRYGPGRERPEEPGWTDSQEVTGPSGGPVVVRVEYADDPDAPPA